MWQSLMHFQRLIDENLLPEKLRQEFQEIASVDMPEDSIFKASPVVNVWIARSTDDLRYGCCVGDILCGDTGYLGGCV